jgi:plasmid stability protein
MATIQIRGLPDEVHRIYQTRAAAAGMSLQEYMRTELIRDAWSTPPGELVTEVERLMMLDGTEGFATASSADLIRADRESH